MYLNSSFERILNFCSSRNQILHGEEGLDLIPGFACTSLLETWEIPVGCTNIQVSLYEPFYIAFIATKRRTNINIRVRCSLSVI